MMLAGLTAAPAFAQDPGDRTLRFGYTSGWSYDGRDDNRDFPTNGVFPGNFAADPANAAVGAAGIFGSNPWHSATPYPSQAMIGSAPDQAYCHHRYRSYDPSSGTFLGRDGVRHRC
jgi:hypothetical protein